MHSYFMRPADIGAEVRYEVETLRDGRGYSTRQVRAFQRGKALYACLASFAAGEPGGEYAAEFPAAIPAPETLPSAAEYLAGRAGGSMTAESKAYWSGGRGFDMRHVPGPVYLTVDGSTGPQQAVWIRPFDALRPVDGLTSAQRDAAALAYVCDYTILEPVLRVLGLPWADERLVTASLDHAMWFHRPGPVDGWLLYAQQAVAAGHGRGLATGRFFGADGDPPGHRRPGRDDPRHRLEDIHDAPGPHRLRRHLRPRQPAARGQLAGPGVRHRPAEVPRAAERRRRDHRRSGHGLRPGPARAQDPGRRRVDLRRAARAGQPDRAGADRGPRPGHRQPRAAALAEQPVDRRRLARRHQGRRHRRHHDGRAAGPRARPDRRQDQAVDRAGRSPVHRRRARGRRQHFSRAAGRRLRRRRRGRPDPAGPRQAGRLRRGGHRGRRRGAVRPHVGQHRRPEDHHPLPPRPAVDRQHLRQADPAAAAGGPGRLHGAVRVHVRPRDAGRVHAPRRGVRLPHRDGDAGPAGGPGRRARGHGARHRAHGLPADPAGRQGRPAVRAAHRGQRGRAHPARDLAAAAGRGRAAGHRRHRRDRDAAHLHQRGRRRHQAGGHRQAGPRLTGPPSSTPAATRPRPASRGGWR